MARILLTGATGFIGGHLAHKLCDRHELYALTRQSSPPPESSSVIWLQQDLSCPLDFSGWPDKIDAVIHLAQSDTYRNFPEQSLSLFQVNTQSTLQLLEYARQAQARSFILASTGGLYGYGFQPFSESETIQPKLFWDNPLGFYFTSKYASELLVSSYQHLLCVTIFRFFFVYGPNQRKQLVPTLIQKVQQDEMIQIDGKPGRLINPIYVDDAVKAIEAAFDLQVSGLFNIAGDQVVSITDLVSLIESVVGKTASITYINASSQGDIVGDNSRMKEILGVLPTTSLAQGLNLMVST